MLFFPENVQLAFVLPVDHHFTRTRLNNARRPLLGHLGLFRVLLSRLRVEWKSIVVFG